MKTCIFFAQTPYQVVVSLSMSYSLIKEELCRVIIIDDTVNKQLFKNRHLLAGVLEVAFISEIPSHFFYKRSFLAVSEVKYLVNNLSVESVNVNLYIFKNHDPVANYLSRWVHDRYGTVFLVEEGLSIYKSGRGVSLSRVMINTIKRVFVRLVTGADINFKFGVSKYIDIVISRDPEALKIYRPDIVVGVNKKEFLYLGFDFKNLVSAIFLSDDILLTDKYRQKKVVVYLGQPLSELRIVSWEEEKRVIEVFLAAARSLNVSVVCKLHPQENKIKYQKIGFSDIIYSDVPSGTYTASLELGAPGIYLYRLANIDVNVPFNDRVFIPKIESEVNGAVKSALSILK